MLRVSVVIPTYNYGRFIGTAIKSVLGQTLRPFEIVVIDDGSEDDTERVVRSFGEAVRYIRQENAGVCAARNSGVQHSEGEVIAFLDADDYFEPSALAKQVGVLTTGLDVGLVYCGVREFDSETGETLKVFSEGAGDRIIENLLLWREPVIAAPGLVVVRREAFEAVGGFDTQMKVGEDWDFCYRVALRYKIGHVPEPLVNYRIHRAAAHFNVHEMERGMSQFYEKAFATDDPSVLRLRRRAYGNFHRILSGSYFSAGDYSLFAKHAARSVAMTPGNIAYFLRFPFRRFSASRIDSRAAK